MSLFMSFETSVEQGVEPSETDSHIEAVQDVGVKVTAMSAGISYAGEEPPTPVQTAEPNEASWPNWPA